MKIRLHLIVLFLLFSGIKTFGQNDCVDAIIICGDANLSDIPTNGFGVQEIFPNNACSSQENNSIWLKIRIRTGGTFGFLLTPQSPALVVDFDFWIYGPNVNCSNIGTAIRCSTTNPLNANLPYNITGMNETETDVSEGPGPDGNGFIHWMTVNDNDIYYIAIDRPVGESNFAIAWTGTATFYQPPTVESIVDLQACETSKPPHGIANFNLIENSANAIGSQTGVTASYYTQYSDAVTGMHPIQQPEIFQNSANPQTVYVRVVDTVTGCSAVASFNLTVTNGIDRDTEFSYTTPVCIEGINPVPLKSANFTNVGSFSATPNGLSINSQTGNINLGNSVPGKYTVTYLIPENNTDCALPERNDFELVVDNCMIPKGVSPNNDGKNDTFDISHFDVRELSIFNRYGVKVYHRANYKNEWTGLTDKGKELPDATYYYLIELRNGEKKTGWVYLLRQD